MTDLDTWTRQLADALDVPPDDLDRDAILDLARVAAHTIARPAAPLTTFLVGYAAGLRGGGIQAVEAAIDTAIDTTGNTTEAALE